MVRPEGFEPPAYWFEASCSIQLSYRRIGKYPYIIRPGLLDANRTTAPSHILCGIAATPFGIGNP